MSSASLPSSMPLSKHSNSFLPNASSASIILKREMMTERSPGQSSFNAVVCVDRSASTQSIIHQSLLGTKDIIHQLPPSSKVRFIGFNDKMQEFGGWVSRRHFESKLFDSIYKQCTPYGSTCLYDTIIHALAILKTRAKTNADAVNFLIVVTDGKDTSSSHQIADLQQAIDSPGFANAHLILVGVSMPPAYEKLLQGLSSKSHFSYVQCAGGADEVTKALKFVHDRVQRVVTTQRVTVEVKVSTSNEGVAGNIDPLTLLQSGMAHIMNGRTAANHLPSMHMHQLVRPSSASDHASISVFRGNGKPNPFKSTQPRLNTSSKFIRSEDGSNATLCTWFHNKSGPGCKNGSNCKFMH